jgi:hypothetical protein
MEQNYLFLHKNHTELFTIKTDDVDKKLFEKNFKKNVSNIIKVNSLSDKYTLVNLHNGVHEDYSIKNN